MKKRLTISLFALFLFTMAHGADDDTFKAQTVEGIDMEFRVISEAEKTCQVGYGEDGNWIHHAVDYTTEGRVTIPATVNGYRVVSVAKWAFMSCSAITSVVIPEGVTSIGTQAFGFTDKLESIILPKSLTVINKSAFSTCTGLKSFTIPEGVTAIESLAFYGCSNLVSISIPNSVVSIGKEAFYHCTSLASVTIPNNVVSIEAYAFEGCSSLKAVVIPEGVTTFGSRVFAGCENLKTVTFKGNIETSWGAVFADCTSLTDIQFSENVTTIPSRLLSGIPNIKSLTIPSTIQKIESTAISECANLEELIIQSEISTEGNNSGIVVACPNLKRVVFNEGISKIPDNIFAYNSDIEEIVFPTTLTEIGKSAFSNSKIKSLTLPDNIEVGMFAFKGCTELKTIKFPQGANHISLGQDAFAASGLTSITIPIGKIYGSAFRNCEHLTSVAFEEGVEYIPGWMFSECPNLSVVSLPSTTKVVNDYAFYLCPSLKSVTCRATTPPLANFTAFVAAYTPATDWSEAITEFSHATLYVPEGAKGAYQTEEEDPKGYWSTPEAYKCWFKFENIVERDMSAAMPGDANADGIVNELDVSAVADYIMGKHSDRFDRNAADVNGDGKVDAADIVLIVNQLGQVP